MPESDAHICARNLLAVHWLDLTCLSKTDQPKLISLADEMQEARRPEGEGTEASVQLKIDAFLQHYIEEFAPARALVDEVAEEMGVVPARFRHTERVEIIKVAKQALPQPKPRRLEAVQRRLRMITAAHVGSA